MTGARPIGEDDLHAYVDGRLPIDQSQEIEAYLETNPPAAAKVAAYREQRDALRLHLQAKAIEPTPARLRVASIVAERRSRRSRSMRMIGGAFAWMLVGVGAGWIMNDALRPMRSATITAEARRPMASEAIAAHRTFVVEVVHPVEVPAAQQTHLLQWLSKRLGKPLAAPDLTGLGFRLIGGRLLPAGSTAAAQFMYDDDRGTRLTLYVRAGESGETAFRFAREGEVSSFFWTDGGLGYVISGALERDRLSAVAKAVYDQLEAASAGRPQPL